MVISVVMKEKVSIIGIFMRYMHLYQIFIKQDVMLDLNFQISTLHEFPKLTG